MKRLTTFFAVLCVCSMAISQQPSWGHWTRWGQQPDGIYVNPVIPSDYSDLDCIRDNCKTYLFRMADDCKSIDLESARLVNEGNHREANKLIRRGKYYYLIFSEHKRHLGRYVMAKRDTCLAGNFKEERQLLLPCREANEPNQGGIVEGPDAQWYFLTHHGTGDWSGRIGIYSFNDEADLGWVDVDYLHYR